MLQACDLVQVKTNLSCGQIYHVPTRQKNPMKTSSITHFCYIKYLKQAEAEMFNRPLTNVVTNWIFSVGLCNLLWMTEVWKILWLLCKPKSIQRMINVEYISRALFSFPCLIPVSTTAEQSHFVLLKFIILPLHKKMQRDMVLNLNQVRICYSVHNRNVSHLTCQLNSTGTLLPCNNIADIFMYSIHTVYTVYI